MIPINELQVGNWVEFSGECLQIATIDKKKKNVILKGSSVLISCKAISGINIYDSNYEERIIEGLLALPDGMEAVEYQSTHEIKYLHELQNKCKDATNIKL